MICRARRRDHRRPDRLPARRRSGSSSSPTPRNAPVVSDALAERLAELQGRPRRPVAGDGARRDPGSALGRHPGGRSPTSTSSALRYYAIAEGHVAGHPGARRPDRLHRRGRLRGVRRVRPGGRALGRALAAGRRRARPRARRARRPRHAPARGRHAALRQRARPGDEPVRGRPGPDREARQAGRLRRPSGPRAGRPRRSGEAARRAHDAGPRDRPPRLPGARRRPADRRRHERHAVADARQGHRDGLRRPRAMPSRVR